MSQFSARQWPTALLLLALCAAVVIANALYNALRQYRPVLQAAPGEVLYAAGFDGFLDEWQQYDGRLSAAVQDGALRLRVDEADTTIYSLTQPLFEDFDLTVTARAVAGPLDGAYGVIFRLETPVVTCDMPLLILCEAARLPLLGVPLRLAFRPAPPGAQGYYMFLISADGFYSVWQATMTGGTTQARRISTWIGSAAIRQGLNVDNQIRITAEGDTFRFFVNGTLLELCIPDDPAAQSTFSAGQCFGGQMIDHLRDDTFRAGQIGLVAQSTASGGPGVVVTFDNLVITSPSAPREEQI